MDRPNPLRTAVVGDLMLGKDADEEKRNLQKLIDDGLLWDRNREGWLARQRALTKLRFGIRKPKSFPWKGASNISVPLIDQLIKKFKPYLMRLLVEPDPIVEFVGEDAAAVENERVAETFYNWLFKTEMSAIETMAYIIDTMCHRGFAFAHVSWDYVTEYETRVFTVASMFPGQPPTDPQQVIQLLVQQYDLDTTNPRVARSLAKAASDVIAGKDSITLAFKRVIADRPTVVDLDPVQVLAPPRTTDYPNAETIIVQRVVPLRWIQQKEADGFFLDGTANSILKDFAKSDSGRQLGGPDAVYSPSLHQERYIQDERERLWGKEDDENVLLWQSYHWHDYNGDGLKERVETWMHPRSRLKCCARPYLYPFHRWPIVKFDFEKTNRRWHSPRGISAMVVDLQKEINAQHNARIDGMTLRNSPCFQMPILAGFKARNFRCTPGTVLQLPAGAQLTPLVQDRGAYPEMVNEENMLRTMAEGYVGVFDAAITSPQSQTTARTATEIQAIQQYTAAVASFDAILFQIHMRDLHTLIWQLYLEFGPPTTAVKVLGDDPNTNAAVLRTINKSDIARRYKLIPTGTIANTNRALELAHAKEALQIYVNDQTGFINPFELRRWHVTLLDYRWARRLLNTPQDAQNLRVLNQAASAVQNDPKVMAALGAQQSLQAPMQPDGQEQLST